MPTYSLPWYHSSSSSASPSVMSLNSSSVRAANQSKRVATSCSSRVMPTPCSRYARLGAECRVDLDSGRCSECIRVGRKAGSAGCNLVVTDEDCECVRSRCCVASIIWFLSVVRNRASSVNCILSLSDRVVLARVYSSLTSSPICIILLCA